MGVRSFETMDGNEAVASVAYRLNEVIAIYPITPASPMGEWSDSWSHEGKPNIWGTVPLVVEMQSEAGAAGTVHGALQTGSLATTFTASQGLLLMIPNMYKIAGELNPTVFHVATRSVATHALSIFCDHSDVMATRAAGFAQLCSASVQEAMDFALIAQAATLETRVPFLHFFDGFRTSHEISKLEVLSDDDLRSMIDDNLIIEHRERALSPDHPVIRGTAENPDVFFQSRERANPFYINCRDVTQSVMEKFSEIAGRSYRLFEYHGAPDAESVIMIMGSGSEVVHEAVDYLNEHGGKVGLVKVRLYRPFDKKRFIESLPSSTHGVAVLDRTKEPGGPGDPLYLDSVAAIHEGVVNGWGNLKETPKIVGGRYGLSSKEFTPAMVKSIFDNLSNEKTKNHFTIGIKDDLTKTSIDHDPEFSTESDHVYRALFYGLGSDGTVGANKNSIKIIGKNTSYQIQGYFVYDSRKAGAVTISHLRVGPNPIHSSYLIDKANFLGCHQSVFLERYDMLKHLVSEGTFLLNTPHDANNIWDQLPLSVQEQIIGKKLKFYIIDAYKIARKSGLGRRINTVMQVCFFAISQILPKDKAIQEIRKTISETYGKQGDEIVNMNLLAIDNTLDNLFEVKVPDTADGAIEVPPAVSEQAPRFVREVLGKMIAGNGDELPVSAVPPDGTFPTGTAKWEKRNLALDIPVWEPEICIQCGKCTVACPHAVIRIKTYEPNYLDSAPETFKSIEARDEVWKGLKYTIQVSPEDCTGCGICVDVCPARSKTETRIKALNMLPQPPMRYEESKNWDFFLSIPETDRTNLHITSIRQQQVQQPLFEFSSACAGCGETPYIKLISQLFGDRLIVANGTGCSSIYGGNLPTTTPWAKNNEGRGPAWSNSLFEDNAEFGLGFRLSIDKQREFASQLIKKLSSSIGENLVDEILTAKQKNEVEIYEQRKRVSALKNKLKGIRSSDGRLLLSVADMLVKKSVWVMGGDGWAYDIGFGGVDHIIASGKDINILVLDTEVYSSTGGQMSKATPRGAIAKFASAGKNTPKKDLGLIAMTYGNVYVASVAMGARDKHTLRAFLEAESYDGPSLIIAYSHCIAHGINMTTAMRNQKAAVDSGQWLLYRFNPERTAEGENPLHLDSHSPKIPVEKYLYMENRFKMLLKTRPTDARRLFSQIREDVKSRWSLYDYLASREFKAEKNIQSDR
ncbi:pyruvate:ferredoxin (flavodoxin) oxidoreductase [Desulfobacterota bacterium AH_259_B03_O07]|nr:pyruvate:ferredoxin (flavodoxin) oxidoreductase [Desulfobacterota bacterium AH_259_B03_O07]